MLLVMLERLISEDTVRIEVILLTSSAPEVHVKNRVFLEGKLVDDNLPRKDEFLVRIEERKFLWGG